MNVIRGVQFSSTSYNQAATSSGTAGSSTGGSQSSSSNFYQSPGFSSSSTSSNSAHQSSYAGSSQSSYSGTEGASYGGTQQFGSGYLQGGSGNANANTYGYSTTSSYGTASGSQSSQQGHNSYGSQSSQQGYDSSSQQGYDSYGSQGSQHRYGSTSQSSQQGYDSYGSQSNQQGYDFTGQASRYDTGGYRLDRYQTGANIHTPYSSLRQQYSSQGHFDAGLYGNRFDGHSGHGSFSAHNKYKDHNLYGSVHKENFGSNHDYYDNEFLHDSKHQGSSYGSSSSSGEYLDAIYGEDQPYYGSGGINYGTGYDKVHFNKNFNDIRHNAQQYLEKLEHLQHYVDLELQDRLKYLEKLEKLQYDNDLDPRERHKYLEELKEIKKYENMDSHDRSKYLEHQRHKYLEELEDQRYYEDLKHDAYIRKEYYDGFSGADDGYYQGDHESGRYGEKYYDTFDEYLDQYGSVHNKKLNGLHGSSYGEDNGKLGLNSGEYGHLDTSYSKNDIHQIKYRDHVTDKSSEYETGIHDYEIDGTHGEYGLNSHDYILHDSLNENDSDGSHGYSQGSSHNGYHFGSSGVDERYDFQQKHKYDNDQSSLHYREGVEQGLKYSSDRHSFRNRLDDIDRSRYIYGAGHSRYDYGENLGQGFRESYNHGFRDNLFKDEYGYGGYEGFGSSGYESLGVGGYGKDNFKDGQNRYTEEVGGYAHSSGQNYHQRQQDVYGGQNRGLFDYEKEHTAWHKKHGEETKRLHEDWHDSYSQSSSGTHNSHKVAALDNISTEYHARQAEEENSEKGEEDLNQSENQEKTDDMIPGQSIVGYLKKRYMGTE